MRLIELDMNAMKTPEEVHRYLAENMNFPDYYGMNLDALYDVLTSGLENNYCVRFVRAAEPGTEMAEFARRLEQVLCDAAETLDEKEDALYAVFADTSEKVDPRKWGGTW